MGQEVGESFGLIAQRSRWVNLNEEPPAVLTALYTSLLSGGLEKSLLRCWLPCTQQWILEDPYPVALDRFLLGMGASRFLAVSVGGKRSLLGTALSGPLAVSVGGQDPY